MCFPWSDLFMTPAGTVDLDALIAELAQRKATRTEADLQSGIQTLLLAGDLNLDDPHVLLETPVPGGRRIDIETGLTVIECKKDLSAGHVRDDAVGQLAGYVRDRTKLLGQRYAGILTDGQEWGLYHLNQADDQFHEVSRFVLDAAEPDTGGLLLWLEGILSTADQLAATPLEIKRRLGADAPGFELDLAELHDIYGQMRNDPEVRQKRELWARLLSAAFGENFHDDDKLFIEHTYLVLTAEVIAHAVLGFDLRSGTLSAQELVTGSRFREEGIGGVVEPDFFDWPVTTGQGVAFVTAHARRLARFEWKDVEHDVLKVLYESVIDTETRHSLGEYYTPDWLAERIVQETVDEPLTQRVLDPACGSGTFVFWAVRRHLEAAQKAGQDNREAVNSTVSSIFGIDLHPVAVTLARVTYLLAIGTDRLAGHDPITIPVYLGDSIQLNQSTSVLSSAGLTVLTSADNLELIAQELNFPESLVSDAGRFDGLVDELATKSSTRLAKGQPPAIGQILTNYGVTEPADREMVERTYKVMCHLYDHQRDHIWGYYVRNLARPLEFTRTEHRVDRLVGNPPWLRYNAMNLQTQANFRRLSRERNLQAPSQVVTSQDLSALFVARSVELYLRLDGRFSFVMPAAALSRLQYKGFRAADYGSQAATAYVAFDEPWELSGVRPQPFPVPASVVQGKRVDASALVPMPDSAAWWSAEIGDHHQSWSKVEHLFTSTTAPVVVAGGDFESPYAELVRQGSNLVPRVLLTVVDDPIPGVLGSVAGRTRVVSDRRSPEKKPWKDLPPLSGSVEDQFIMPILVGGSLLPYALRGDTRAIIPWDGGKLLTGDDTGIDAYKGLAEWWRKAEGLFVKHRSDTSTMDLNEQIDYQSKLRLQFPLRAHRVAYTGRGERVTAARITDPHAVVDHALYWAGFTSKEEAQYVAAVINSEALNDQIQSALSKGLFGGRNIHRAPFLIAWPEYDPAVCLHRDIAAAAGKAEKVAAVAGGQTGGIASARRKVRQALGADGVAAEIEALVSELLDAPPANS